MKQKRSACKATRSHDSSISAHTENKRNKNDEAELKGLCVTCDKRFDCLMSNQPGGVWYCEEFT
jgi:hypothetical protein